MSQDREEFIPDRDSIFNDDFDYPEYDEMYDLSDEPFEDIIRYEEFKESARDLVDDLNEIRAEQGLELIPYEETCEARRARQARDAEIEAERWAGQDRWGEHSASSMGQMIFEAFTKAKQ